MMSHPLEAIIRRHVRPLKPQPTDQSPRLARLPGTRAVLFDVYGTMIISASGDVGTAAEDGRVTALVAALASCGIRWSGQAQEAVDLLLEAIAAAHQRKKAQGIEYPEVDIRQIWRQVLTGLAERGQLELAPEAVDVERLALEYEMRVNPVWPMPGVERLLARSRDAGLLLGIVSNAQFFSPPVVETLLESPLVELGFRQNLQFYSYRYDRAKPGLWLYERAREALAEAGIEPAEALYVGNDMLNDVAPAAAAGFRTALFAGDARSLRLREGDSRVAGLRPDVVVTHLDQLHECLFPTASSE